MKLGWMASVGAAALALAAAGCGSDDEGSATAGTSTGGGSEGAQLSGEPIKIGHVSPQGSPIIDIPYQEAILQATVDGVNERGGIAGRPVELVYCNDKTDVNTAQTCAREMVKEGVVATVGDVVLTGDQYMPILEQAGVPAVALNPMTERELNGENSFPIDGGTQVGTLVATAYAMHAGVPTALLPSDNPTNLALVKVIEEVAEQAGGSFTSKVPIAPNQTDYAPLVASAEQDGAEAALLQVAPAQGVQFIAAAEKAGAPFESYFLPGPASGEAVEQIGQEAASKVIYATAAPLTTSDNPLVQQFNEDLDAYAEKTGEDTASAAGNNGILPWLGVYALKQLIEQEELESVTAETLTQELRDAKDLDLGGVVPAWTPENPGPEGMARLSNTSYYIGGFQDGEQVLFTEEPVSLADAIEGVGLPEYPPQG